MKWLKHLVEYGLIKLVEGILRSRPLEESVRWGESLGGLLRRALGRRDRLVIENLTAAFPEKGPEEIQRIAEGFWRNVGRVAVEFVRAPEIVPEPIGNSHDVENIDVFNAAFAEKKGVIFVSAHYCNWEMNGIFLHRLTRDIGHKFTAISRPMRNPRAAEWVQSRRASGGVPVILHRRAVRESLRVLRSGESMGMLVDQNLYQGGIFAKFFGRPAATTFLPALLHSRTGAPVVLTWVTRVDTRFCIHFERIRFPDVPEDRQLDAGTQEINDRLEAVIRKKPEWWFWIHNRWKRSAEAAAR
jgi:Kdo2-lipid IVA lauroyltransferase/acyltransferase